MKPLIFSLYESWVRRVFLGLALIVLILLGYLCLFFLNRLSSSPGYENPILPLLLFSFYLPIFLCWFASPLACILLVLPGASFFFVLAGSAMHTWVYLLFIPFLVLLCFLFFYLDQTKNVMAVSQNIEIEKAINEKNDMELNFKEEGTSISVFFEKYSSYYNLRNLAIDFSTTLSLRDLSQTIVFKVMELIPNALSCHLFLVDPDAGELSLIASKSTSGERKTKSKTGSLFDHWIIQNKHSLIVTDTQKDFRFDFQKLTDEEEVKNLIAAPLVHEGKVVGALRLNSAKVGALNTDDLRLLDAIATLASSALSNSLLFQKTEELAIRDSLTGLYVQRYFLERLAEEHKRSLLTGASLTLLMCDLDHFKACNDHYGHGIGDYALVKTGEILQKKAGHGIVARYGGEEFAVLFPKLSLDEGCHFAEAIRSALQETKFVVRREEIPITISIGAASIPSDTLDSEELIRIADRRLYQAKKNGRNQICCAD